MGLPFADPDLSRLDDEHVVADVAFVDDVVAVRDDEFRFTGGPAASRFGAPARRCHPLRSIGSHRTGGTEPVQGDRIVSPGPPPAWPTEPFAEAEDLAQRSLALGER